MGKKHEIKSVGYYQTLYVQRGKTGEFKDSVAGIMMQQDALSAQREMARRLASATMKDEEKSSHDKK